MGALRGRSVQQLPGSPGERDVSSEGEGGLERHKRPKGFTVVVEMPGASRHGTDQSRDHRQGKTCQPSLLDQHDGNAPLDHRGDVDPPGPKR